MIVNIKENKTPDKCKTCDMPEKYRPEHPGTCGVCYQNQNTAKKGEDMKITKKIVTKWDLIRLIDNFVFDNFSIAGLDSDKLINTIDNFAENILNRITDAKYIYSDIADIWQEINELKGELKFDEDDGEY